MAYWSRDFMEDWIPVWVRLPEPHQRVIVTGYNPQNHYDRHINIAVYKGGKGWDSIWSKGMKVSHWMPLPKLPEEL